MKRIALLAATGMLMASSALAQTTTMPPASETPSAAAPAQAVTTIPASNVALSDFYRQSVYDSANSKIGDISDVLISTDKRASLAIIGVGGFLGIGEKNVAVPFDSIKRTVRDGKVYLTMDANKDQLKAAQGLRYDRVTNAWAVDTDTGNATATPPANRPATTPNTMPAPRQ